MKDKLNSRMSADAEIIRGSGMKEGSELHGHYEVECYDKDGNLKWKDTIKNLVTTVGKNLALNSVLETAVTVVGPYMGLISSVSYTAIAATDTMTISGRGWLEAGSANAPTYSGTRKTCVWSAAANGSKALSAALSFGITGSGTVKGCFIVLGTGASNAIANESGTLYSAGLFTGGDKVVANNDTLNVSYTASL